MTYLLDTNVVSERRKRRCDPNVAAWFESVEGVDKYLSSLAIGELTRGVHQLTRRDPPQAARLADWLNRLKEEFANRVIPVDTEAAIVWGRWSALENVPTADGLMAATAYLRDWTFVTRNVKHVERTGVRALNPWAAA